MSMLPCAIFLIFTRNGSWKSEDHLCTLFFFYWNLKGKTRKKRKNTASLVASLGDGVQPRSTVQLFLPVSDVEESRFRNYFSAFGWHLARKSLSWPTMTVSNKKQEFEQRKRIKLFDDFWVRVCRLILARGAGLVHCRLFTNSRLSRFQFSSFWSIANGLDSSVFILLRFCYVVYARAKMHCYRFFSFDLRKMLCICNVKADQVG